MGQKLLLIFKNDLNSIKDEEFKKHVEEIISLVPDYITEIPSSSTGKYHPRDEIAKDGMIKHIKRCLVFADETAKMLELNQDDLEILISGCILHDSFKNGPAESINKWTVPEHPIFIYGLIKSYIKKNDLTIDQHTKSKLHALAIACLLHEGQWTIDKSVALANEDTFLNRVKKEDTEFSIRLFEAMHYVDYYASRRSVYDIMREVKYE